MYASEYHAWLIAKLEHCYHRDAGLAYEAKEAGDMETHYYLSKSANHYHTAMHLVMQFDPTWAKNEWFKTNA